MTVYVADSTRRRADFLAESITRSAFGEPTPDHTSALSVLLAYGICGTDDERAAYEVQWASMPPQERASLLAGVARIRQAIEAFEREGVTPAARNTTA